MCLERISDHSRNIAEDEVSMSEAVTDILAYHNYIVDAVYDREEALDYARTEDYDGMILDIMMPKKNGFGKTVQRRMKYRRMVRCFNRRKCLWRT